MSVPAILAPRATESDGRLVIRYAVGVVLVWIGLAMAGVVGGFLAEPGQGRIIGLGLAAICLFVAAFAARPVVVADRTGLAVLPLFGSRTTLRWSEVEGIGVRRVRAARGRGEALMIEASDDREIKVDGLWVGLSGGALSQIEQRIAAFADGIGVGRSLALADPVAEPW